MPKKFHFDQRERERSMMEVDENLISDLQSLNQLYTLLRLSSPSPQHFLLGEKARLLLKRLLDGAAEQAFQRHAKIIASQSAIVNANWSKHSSLQDHPNNNNRSKLEGSNDEESKQKSNNTTNTSTAAILANSGSMNSRSKKRCKICGKSTLKRLNSSKEQDNISSSSNQNNNDKTESVVIGGDAREPSDRNKSMSRTVVIGPTEELPSEVPIHKANKTDESTQSQQHEFPTKRNHQFNFGEMTQMGSTSTQLPRSTRPNCVEPTGELAGRLASRVPTTKPPIPSINELIQSQQPDLQQEFSFGRQKNSASTPAQALSLTRLSRVEPTSDFMSRMASQKAIDVVPSRMASQKISNSVGARHAGSGFTGPRTQVKMGRNASHKKKPKSKSKPKPKPMPRNIIGGPTFASTSETDQQLRQMVVRPTLLDQPPHEAKTMGPTRQGNHQQQRLKITGPPRLKDLPRQQESDSSTTSTSETASPSWTSEESTSTSSSDSEVNSLPRRIPTQHHIGATSERVLSCVSRKQRKAMPLLDHDKRRGRATSDDSYEAKTRSRHRGGSAEIGRLERIKDKLGFILHHHHHHHHHQHSESDNDDVARSNQNRSMWGYMRNMMHRRETEENPIEEVTHGKKIRPRQQQQQQGHLHALVDGLLRHVWNSKKSKPSPREIGRLGRNKKKVVRKWHWWQSLYKSGKRGGKVGSSGRLGFNAKRHHLPDPTKRRQRLHS